MIGKDFSLTKAYDAAIAKAFERERRDNEMEMH